MTINDITSAIEAYAPKIYQESYDNAGLLTGNKSWNCSGALLTLDCVEDVVDEAIDLGFNLIIAHHPIIFKGIKSLTGKNYIERTIIKAIKNDVAIYASHTNMDNIWGGVNGKIGEKLGLLNPQILAPKSEVLYKLSTFAPVNQADDIRNAMFKAGAGRIGSYTNCSFNTEGIGTFRGNSHSNPTVGVPLQDHHEKEIKIEMLVPIHAQSKVVKALFNAHPYEEVAYDMVPLANQNQGVGGGLVGDLPEEVDSQTFLESLKTTMKASLVRYTSTAQIPKIKRVAVCGGSGSFLLKHAKSAKADIYISADFKYHEFFDADGDIIIADIGHFESEQFTAEIFASVLTQKFPNFALRFSNINTNPINYL